MTTTLRASWVSWTDALGVHSAELSGDGSFYFADPDAFADAVAEAVDATQIVDVTYDPETQSYAFTYRKRDA